MVDKPVKCVHILLVAKDKTVLETVSALLFNIFTPHIIISQSTKGYAALESCGQMQSDFILYEYDMSDLNGLAFYDCLAQDPILNDIPIIMLIDKNTEKTLINSKVADYFDFLLKENITIKSLNSAMAKAVKRKTVVAKLKSQQDLLETVTFYDYLTGLPNAAFFERILDKGLARAKRYSRFIGFVTD